MRSIWNAQAYTMYHVLTRCDPYEMHKRMKYTMYHVLTRWNDPYEMHKHNIQCTMY